MDPSTPSGRSIRHRMTVVTLLPLLVFSFLFVLVFSNAVSRVIFISEFSGTLEFLPKTLPFRERVSQTLDSYLIGEIALQDASGKALTSLEAEVAKLQQIVAETDLGFFNTLIRDPFSALLTKTTALKQQADAELQSNGRVSQSVLMSMQRISEESYLTILRTVASFTVEKLPVENAKYVHAQSVDLNMALDINRREILSLLKKREINLEDAVALLVSFHDIDRLLERFEARENTIDWIRVARFIQQFKQPVKVYLAQPLIQQIRMQMIPGVLAGAEARILPPDSVPVAAEWYRSQSENWEAMRSASLSTYLDTRRVSERTIAREMLIYLLLMTGLMAAMAYSIFNVRNFSRRLVADVSGLERTLAKVTDSGDFEARVNDSELLEFSRIATSVNHMLDVRLENESKIAELLAVSQANEERLAAKSQELEKTVEQLAEQTAVLRASSIELHRQSREIERTSRYKSEFLANMSHELRTPLNSVLILSSDLAANRAGNLDSEEAESASMIHEAGAGLLSLINDILDIASVEAGRISLELEPVNLRALADSLDQQFRPLAEKKALSLDFVFAEGLPEQFMSDYQRLHQIIASLLSNAIKFTRNGCILVTFQLRPAEAGKPEHICILVIDSGIGIATDKMDTVFNLFEQADGSSTRSFGGTGLGLSLSRRFAELLGGTLQVESQVGVGSRFTVSLPLTRTEHGDAMPHFSPPEIMQSERSPLVEREKARELPEKPAKDPLIEAAELIGTDPELAEKMVLLVDHDMRSMFNLNRALRQVGMLALKAPSVEKCISALQESGNRVDFVLLDVLPPGSDRSAAVRQVCQVAGPAGAIVIVMAAEATRDDQEACLQAGAVDYLEKPLDFENLLARLRAHLKQEEA